MNTLIEHLIARPLYFWWLRVISGALPTCTLWRPAKQTRQFEFVLCPWIKIDELTVVLARSGQQW